MGHLRDGARSNRRVVKGLAVLRLPLRAEKLSVDQNGEQQATRELAKSVAVELGSGASSSKAVKHDGGHCRGRVDQGHRRSDRGYEDQDRLSLDREITPQSRHVRDGAYQKGR